MTALDVRSGMTVVDARLRIGTAVTDSATTAGERAYYESMLATLKGLDSEKPVGDTLDDLPCALE